MMVSKKGKRGLVTGSGSKASGLSSKGRISVVAEASCRGEWLENVEAPAHSSAAMCHHGCGHSPTGGNRFDCCRRRQARPAGDHVGSTAPPPRRIHRSCSFSAPRLPRPSESAAQVTDRTGVEGWLQSRHQHGLLSGSWC